MNEDGSLFWFISVENLYKATSLVAPGGGASPAIFHKMFLHMVGHLSVFVRYLEPIPTYIPGWGGGGGRGLL